MPALQNSRSKLIRSTIMLKIGSRPSPSRCLLVFCPRAELGSIQFQTVGRSWLLAAVTFQSSSQRTCQDAVSSCSR